MRTSGSKIGNDQSINPVNVSGGLFTVALNSGGEFGGNAFEGSTRFLEITVLCPGDANAVMLPRQPLTAAPYAITSLSAEGLQGRPVSNIAPTIGQTLAWDGSHWTPQTFTSGGPLDWNSLSNIPAGFADDVDNEGAAPDWNTLPNIPAGFADNVDNDSGGDITVVNAGSGLSGGGGSGDVALALDTGVTDNLYWQLDGNAGVPSTGFLGTGDNITMTLGVGNAPALRLLPAVDQVDGSILANIVGGASSNGVTPGVIGATIAGGGRNVFNTPNLIFDNFGTIGGGMNNHVGSNDDSVISDQFATIAGGNGNQAAGEHSSIGGGQLNQAVGTASVVSGGESNLATGAHTTIPGGHQALAHLPGQLAYAGGGFDNEVGSAQMSIYVLRSEGVGNRTLLMEGGNLLAVRAGTSMVFTIYVIGRANSGNATAAFRIEGSIVGGDNGGTATFSQPLPVKTSLGLSSPLAALFNVRVETTGGTLNIIGENRSTESVRWVATVYATEVKEG